MDSDQKTSAGSWPHRLAVTIWTGLLLGSWLLASRAAAGALGSPLAPAVALFVTATTGAIGLLAAVIHRHIVTRPAASTTPLVITLSLAPALITGVILVDLSRSEALVGLLAVMLCIVIMVLWSESTGRDSRPARETETGTAGTTGLLDWPQSTTSRPPDESDVPPAKLSQEFQRQRDSTGDRLEGQITIEWQPGQQQQSVHVPFVPAFRDVPEVSCSCDQQGHDPSVRARVAEIRRFGARVELKCSTAPGPISTKIDFVAMLETSSRQAA
ncbi:MAG: hypothetical protein CMJ65_04770 [Planctomycetaceae bacterium]|jgi:hypothetical protein|nr:hypothetical protein [Planctomycetaceae bacterium]